MKSHIFCIPYAGGQKSFFSELSRCLVNNGDDISVTGLEYPGHAARWKEKSCRGMQELIEDAAAQINGALSKEEQVFLFGYSMGSLVAYELMSQHLLCGEVKHLFLAAHCPPDDGEIAGKGISCMDDEQLAESLKGNGGISDEILSNRRFWKMYAKMIRDDYRILEGYWFDGTHDALPVSATMFYSEEDTPLCTLQGWERYVSDIRFHRFEGNHFFLKNHAQETAAIIASVCRDL